MCPTSNKVTNYKLLRGLIGLDLVIRNGLLRLDSTNFIEADRNFIKRSIKQRIIIFNYYLNKKPLELAIIPSWQKNLVKTQSRCRLRVP